MNDEPGAPSREWNAASYHRVSAPQVSWGRKVLAQLPLQGDETVLDAGCGTGRLTLELAELLASGHIVGVDLSQNMLLAAREHLGENFAPRTNFARADLLELPFDAAFDGIFSTAAFHWVRDHDRLFCSLYGALKPGGWLCAQCGGRGNLARWLDRISSLSAAPAYAHALEGLAQTWEFADAETTSRRLERAGFTEISTDVVEAPIHFDNGQKYREFVGTVILRNALERMPSAEMREGLLDELTRQAAADEPRYLLDYWRLNMRARKPVMAAQHS